MPFHIVDTVIAKMAVAKDWTRRRQSSLAVASAAAQDGRGRERGASQSRSQLRRKTVEVVAGASSSDGVYSEGQPMHCLLYTSDAADE